MAISRKPHSGLPTLFSILFLLALATSKVQSATESVSFSYPPFSTNDTLRLQGDAEIVNGTLRLTNHQAPRFKTGRALYDEPVPIWDKATGNVASFTASFSFVVETYKSITPADGIIFFLAPENGIPHFSGAGQLGVVNAFTAFNNFVGVEFDSYSNDWDPSFPHIGIDVNSLISLKTVKWNRASGSLVRVSIIYDGSSKNLAVAATYPNREIATVSQAVDLKAVFSKKAKVWVGLSATTALGYETHDIYSWSFTSSLEIGKNQNIASYAA